MIGTFLLTFAQDFVKSTAKITTSVVGGGLAVVYLDQHVAGFRRVDGPSMSPTLNKDEHNAVKLEEDYDGNRDRLNHDDYVYFTRKFELGRGDVVILDDPKSRNNILCKRVVALAGDQVVSLGVNSVRRETVQLGEGQVWVESDAGFGYKDSNLFGPVRADTIQGKVQYAGQVYPNRLFSHTRRIVSAVPEGTLARVTVAHHLFCFSVVKDVSLVYCAWYTFTNLVGFPAAVNGKSMQPTLNPGHTRLGVLDSDWVWVNCWRARRYKMARGDLLVYTSPKDPEEYLIKRMIAGEGDVVHTEGRHSKAVVRVPQGHVWAEGDNWGNSVDSNMYGPVPKGLVSGVARTIIWPPSRMQVLEVSVPDMLKPSRVTRAEVRTELTNRPWPQFWKILFYFIRN